MHKMIPMTEALLSDPSYTAITTPNTMTNSPNSSFLVGVFFSMKTDPTAATTGMHAL
jgi:hypothetical protein